MCRDRLINCNTILLVIQSTPFREYARSLALRDVTQYIFHLVFDAALPARLRKSRGYGMEHPWVAVLDPHSDGSDTARLEIVQPWFPRRLVLAITDAKGEDFVSAFKDFLNTRRFFAVSYFSMSGI